MSEQLHTKELENEFIKYWIEDGILYSEYKQPLEINMENITQIIALRHQISSTQKQYWCCNIYNIKYFTKEAQNYAETHGQDYLYACAVVVSSYLAQFVFNAFAIFRKVDIPFRAFETQDAAVEWLKILKESNENWMK